MTLRVVGAGLGRTGTHSLKIALERLLGAPCYHMVELESRPEHIPVWHAAARGQLPDWHELLKGYAAAVDWPAASFWPELSEAFPDAVVLLSVRDSQSWWESANETIFTAIPRSSRTEWRHMIAELFANRFTAAIKDQAAAIAAFERHYARVRESVPAHRLVEWKPADGWAPLCAALDLPVPDEPFPRTNTSEKWRASKASKGKAPTIRPEQAGDETAIAHVHTSAFEGPDEAEIVAKLRKIAQPYISLVAHVDGHLVGHVLFTPVTIRGDASTSQALGLAPMAVLPEHQGGGIGSALARAGLAACADASQPVIFVLGAPGFYTRFGFRLAAPAGLRFRSAEFDAHFMVAELAPGALAGRTGWVEYLPPFDEV